MIIQCTKYQVPQTYLLQLSTGVVLSEEFQNASWHSSSTTSSTSSKGLRGGTCWSCSSSNAY